MKGNMFIEIERQDFKKYKSMLSGFNYVIAVFASLEGDSKGKLYLNDRHSPSVAMLWNELDGFYISATDTKDIENIKEVISKILDENKDTLEDLDEYVIYVDLHCGEEHIRKIIPSTKYEKRLVKLFSVNKIEKMEYVIPSGFHVLNINEDLTTKNYKNVNEIKQTILNTWKSIEAFYKKGFGVALLDEKSSTIASYCLTEHVYEDKAEFSIETDESYQRKGLGFITGSIMLELCKTRNNLPFWYCMADNKPSIALAKKLNLEEEMTFPVWFFEIE